MVVHPLITASGSIGAVEMVDQIPAISPKVEIIKLIIQLAIGIVALLKLRKPKAQ